MEPSAKGSVVVGVVASLRVLKKQGRVSEDQLSARLSAAALKLVGEKIESGRWYPMPPVGELIELEWELAARDPQYARQSGAQSADRMFATGLYQQLDYAERVGRAENRDALLRQTKLITTVTGTLYSYLTIAARISPDGDELEIVYGNATLFSEALRYSTEGFMNRVNERQNSARRWTSTRVRPDEIKYSMKLPKRLAGER